MEEYSIEVHGCPSFYVEGFRKSNVKEIATTIRLNGLNNGESLLDIILETFYMPVGESDTYEYNEDCVSTTEC